MPGKKRAGGAAATRGAIKEREEEYMDAGAADEPTADKRPRHSNEVYPPLAEHLKKLLDDPQRRERFDEQRARDLLDVERSTHADPYRLEKRRAKKSYSDFTKKLVEVQGRDLHPKVFKANIKVLKRGMRAVTAARRMGIYEGLQHLEQEESKFREKSEGKDGEGKGGDNDSTGGGDGLDEDDGDMDSEGDYDDNYSQDSDGGGDDGGGGEATY